MEKAPLLLLCHRIPYPPNKGDKIRAFHLLQHLSVYFDIYLASFVDDPDDWVWATEVEKFCSDTFLRPLRPLRATLRSLRGLVTGQALSVPYYADAEMRRWVQHTVTRHAIGDALVYSSCMAQFLPAQRPDFRRKVIDFVDVDSDKWAQYAQKKRWPMRWVYQREARFLFALERRLAQEFDAGLFVSSTEAALFRRLAPETAAKIGHYNNGVDSEYFTPDFDLEKPVNNPFAPGSLPLVFTGAMDYWPNVDAVCWFVRSVLPILRRRLPAVEFYIVGSNPPRQVQSLSQTSGVTVTGRVPDVRPFLKHAIAAVAPMRIARGIQNKVLEAMAMGRPVLVTARGLEGIDAGHGKEVLLAESAEEYCQLLEGLAQGAHAAVGTNARDWVKQNFSWDHNLREVSSLLRGDGCRFSARGATES